MPLPLLAGAIGKGLLGGAKTVGAATKSGAAKTFSVGKYLAKESIQGATNLAQRGAKVARQGGKKVVKGAKFFKQKVGSIRKRGGNIARRLKESAINLRESLKRGNKNQEKLRTKKQQRKRRAESIKKKREKEKQLEANKSSSDQKKTEKNLAKSSLGSFDKLFAFGGLLLGGILVNAFEGLKKKAEEFYVNNKELFDTIGGFLTKVKDSVVGLLDSFTGPESEEGAYDGFAKFGDNGKLLPAPDGGALSEFVKVIEDLKPAIEKINDATKNPIVKALEKSGFIPERSLMDRSKEFVTGTGPGQLNNYETQRQSESQESVKGQTSEGLPSPASSAPDLKTAIRRAESGNDYGATFRAYLDGFSRRNEDITNMSINQVVQYQKDYIAHQRKLGIPETKRSAAVGAYQMLYPEVAASKTGVPLTAKFNKENQDRMADYYLNMAGYQQFINGRITAEQFNNRLAGQFASLKTTSGRGVYDSDGINRAYEDLLDLIRKSKPQPKITPVPDKGDQARVINQPDPTDEEVATLFIQRVNTIQYVPVPVTA